MRTENSEISRTLIIEFRVSVAHSDNRFFVLRQQLTMTVVAGAEEIKDGLPAALRPPPK